MLSQRATCVNIPPIFEVGINIVAEDYVRSTYAFRMTRIDATHDVILKRQKI